MTVEAVGVQDIPIREIENNLHNANTQDRSTSSTMMTNVAGGY